MITVGKHRFREPEGWEVMEFVERLDSDHRTQAYLWLATHLADKKTNPNKMTFQEAEQFVIQITEYVKTVQGDQTGPKHS